MPSHKYECVDPDCKKPSNRPGLCSACRAYEERKKKQARKKAIKKEHIMSNIDKILYKLNEDTALYERLQNILKLQLSEDVASIADLKSELSEDVTSLAGELKVGTALLNQRVPNAKNIKDDKQLAIQLYIAIQGEPKLAGLESKVKGYLKAAGIDAEKVKAKADQAAKERAEFRHYVKSATGEDPRASRNN